LVGLQRLVIRGNELIPDTALLGQAHFGLFEDGSVMEGLEIIAHGTRAIFRNGMGDGSRLLATLLMERIHIVRRGAMLPSKICTVHSGSAQPFIKQVFPHSQPRWRVSQ